MKKKLFAILLIAALLVIPVQGAAPNRAAAQEPIAAAEVMTPAIHGILLAMVHREADIFDAGDANLAWEALYNALSLYGQLDERSEYDGEFLVIPEETAADFAAALSLDMAALGPLPAGLTDRMTYLPESGCYRLVCGSDSLAQVEVETVEAEGNALALSGALVSEAEGGELVRFEAGLEVQDNMFGCAVTGLTIV